MSSNDDVGLFCFVLIVFLQDYVVDKWDEVSVSDEFEQCCQEVASGEYVSCAISSYYNTDEGWITV